MTRALQLFAMAGIVLSARSCNPAVMGPVLGAPAPPVAPNPASYPTPNGPPNLRIFGGYDHRTFLGYLTCNASDNDSIFNKSGQFGSCSSYGTDDSLYCRGAFAKFGDTGILANESACSPGANDPPVIVDQQGRYYGRFSVASSYGHNDSVCSGYSRFHNDEACKLVKYVCSQ
jgi:hypothetical protein